MKKVLVSILIIMVVGTITFAQELEITRVESNTKVGWDDSSGGWPVGKAGQEWNNVLKKYNLVRLQSSDPFEKSDGLEQRIGSLAAKRIDYNPGPYTVYLTMRNRRFICFIYYDYMNYRCWVYEVK